MKNLARLLTRPGPSLAFWAFVYGIYKLQVAYLPDPTTLDLVVGCVLLFALSLAVSVLESLIYLWSSKK